MSRHPLRLLLITAHYPYGGTSEEFLTEEIAALLARGVSVEVLPVRRQGRPRPLPSGASLAPESLTPSPSLAAVRTAWGNRRVLREILRTLLRERSSRVRNLVVTPLALRAASRAVNTGCWDHVHAHWLSHTATLAWQISRLTSLPFSATAHRWDIYTPNLFERKAADAEFLRFISLRGLTDFSKQVGGAKDTFHVVHMGVAVPDGAALQGHVRERVAIAAVGALLPIKGHTYLLQALAELKARGIAVDLHLFGQGPLWDNILSTIRELSLEDSVRLRGSVPRVDLLREYAEGSFDLFVMPSLDLGPGEHEGIPVSLMEAMAHEIPIIATRTGSIPELVVDGENGLLVDDKSAEQLANAIEKLTADLALRQKVGHYGRGSVLADFSASNTAKVLVKLFGATSA